RKWKPVLGLQVGRSVPGRGGGLKRRGGGTERELRSVALSALTAFRRGGSARVPARTPRTGEPRRRRICDDPATYVWTGASRTLAIDPPGRGAIAERSAAATP